MTEVSISHAPRKPVAISPGAAMAPHAAEAGSAWLRDGVEVACEEGDARRGDLIEVHVGDDLVGSAMLRAGRRGGPLSAQIPLVDVPDLAFPAWLRVVNARSGREIGAGLAIRDAAALIAAAGAPRLVASFAGLLADGIAFSVTPDRLVRHPRTFALHLAGSLAASALSEPDPGTGAPQRVVFSLAQPVAPGTPFQVMEARFGITALAGTFDTALALAGALAQAARLERAVAVLHEANATLRRRLDTSLDLGRERLLLDRLDLFYLLLCERIGGAAGVRPAACALPQVRRFGPAEVDGIGIFDVETDGEREWRWFGPDATVALRDIAGPVRRVILYFHSFGDAQEPPLVRASTGGPAEPARLRFLEPGYALEVPVAGATSLLQGMLVVHLSFDRHQTSAADPRLLSAVFSGAEVISADC